MPDTVNLSEVALTLQKRHMERNGEIRVDDANRETYRELAQAGLMLAGHSFKDGREAFYVFTKEGWARCREWLNALPTGPSPSKSG